MTNDQIENKSTLKEDLPLVSVCLAVFNNEKTVKRAIDSILNQKTNFKFEVVINDDPANIENRPPPSPINLSCMKQALIADR